MGPVTRQTPGLEGQKPGKLEELQKQLSQLGGSIEASTNQTVPVGSPFVTANQSIPQAEVSKPTATDEPFAIPAEEAPLSEAFPSQPDSSTVEPSAASIPGTSSGVPGNSGSSQGSPPQFVSQARHPMEQVLEGTAYSVKNGHKELNIRLNPDNLGEVRVNLVSLGNNELSARLIASTPESHALLQSQADTLKTSLEAQGIRVEHLTVVLAGSQDARGNMGQGTGSDQQQQHYQQSSGHSGNLAQQDFNREDQPGSNVFAQMNQSGGGPFQQKSGFAQNPISGPYRSVSDDAASLETSRTEARSQSHDNGSISILA
jgi:flagellar hook-length control protein FliK